MNDQKNRTMENVTPTALSNAFTALREALGEERNIVVLLTRVEGDELVVQYATTMELHETVEALRDSADALEGKMPSREAELN